MTVALLAIPVGAFASHQFTDVPNSHQFHNSISKLKGAAITAGCTATKYCPGNAVNRGSMAAFLTRAVGRAGTDQIGTAITVAGEDQVIAEIDLKAGDITGGTAYVMVTATVTGYTLGITGCPCTTDFYLTDSDGDISNDFYTAIDSLNFDATFGIDSTAINVLVPVPTGVTRTYSLWADVFHGSETVTVYGELTAAYIPFGPLGSNPSLTSTAGERAAPGGAPGS